MDDGSKSRGNIIINTHRYMKEDQERVLLILKGKYGIEGNVNLDRGKYRILISAKSTREILIPRIKGYIIKCFRYKLGKS